jgi:hypothetical protein
LTKFIFIKCTLKYTNTMIKCKNLPSKIENGQEYPSQLNKIKKTNIRIWTEGLKLTL